MHFIITAHFIIVSNRFSSNISSIPIILSLPPTITFINWFILKILQRFTHQHWTNWAWKGKLSPFHVFLHPQFLGITTILSTVPHPTLKSDTFFAWVIERKDSQENMLFPILVTERERKFYEGTSSRFVTKKRRSSSIWQDMKVRRDTVTVTVNLKRINYTEKVTNSWIVLTDTIQPWSASQFGGRKKIYTSIHTTVSEGRKDWIFSIQNM